MISRLPGHMVLGLVCGVVLLGGGCATGQNYARHPYLSFPAERPYADQRQDYAELNGRYSETPADAESNGSIPDGRDSDDYVPDAEPRAAPPPRSNPQHKIRVAALPAEADPAYSTPVDLDGDIDPGQSTRGFIDDPTREPAGTVTINTKERKLYLSIKDGQAIEYGIGVGREGFAWKGIAEVGRKAFWPGWTPPKEMLLRRPDLPPHMDGSLENPLGARALYLFKGGKDTLFRIHGTNEPDTIGKAVSSGCIRMLNADVIDLYHRVMKGTRVVVL